jgi:hypothetical protein
LNIKVCGKNEKIKKSQRKKSDFIFEMLFITFGITVIALMIVAAFNPLGVRDWVINFFIKFLEDLYGT